MWKLAWLLFSVVLAAGCAPFIPVVKIEELPAGQKAAIDAMPVYEARDLARRRYVTIAQVEGFSCQDLLWAPGASREDAVRQVKHWALQKGADGITNLTCGAKEGVSLITNCWETIRCAADAIKLGK
jgi:hypothetical protein